MNPFASPSMAEGYAKRRPALHAHIVERARTTLGMTTLGDVALDIGCGSGLSTKPLQGLARLAAGIEPVWEMTHCARFVAPDAWFVNGRGEQMPFGDASVDFITAAGSLNFARPEEVLREAWRVLKPDGVLVAYDFAQGREFNEGGELGLWFDAFLRRYPRPPSEAIALDPAKLEAMGEGYAAAGHEEFALALPYTWSGYADYIMTETNVAAAVRAGHAEASIRQWLDETLPRVFGRGPRNVVFPGYWVALKKSPPLT